MSNSNAWRFAIVFAAAAFLVGRWSTPAASVRADSSAPQFSILPIRGDNSLTVFYPAMNKLFVYQNPFIGLPKWSCAYSIQLGKPGETIERQPCPNASFSQ